MALTFDDVLLSPSHSMVHPRDVSTATRFTRAIDLNVPLVSAAKDTVTESAMAIAGGVNVIGVLRAPHAEGELAPRQPGQVARPEHAAGGEPAGEMVDRGAAHEGVVDIEEGGRGRIWHRGGLIDLGHCG